VKGSLLFRLLEGSSFGQESSRFQYFSSLVGSIEVIEYHLSPFEGIVANTSQVLMKRSPFDFEAKKKPVKETREWDQSP
jgi:hypothetical protein